MKKSWLSRLWESFSAVGLLTGTLFFAASLTPSLVPRTFATQGVLSGCSLAAGYGIGVLGLWLWNYLQLPKPGPRVARAIRLGATGLFAVVAIAFLWRASEWQNSIRLLMELEPVDSAHPTKVGLIAMLVFVALMVVARAFQLTFRVSSRNIGRFAPRPVSNLVGVVIAALLFWSIVDGVIFRAALHMADSSFQQLDALIEDDTKQPADPSKTGSAASLLDWNGLGRAGRQFVATGPTRADIGTFLGRDALEPIRVYAGLNSAETADERARLALDELKRVGGFDRSVLIIITPTGTGWVDPAAMDTVEYLLDGDVASVALQYSYLTSWLSLLVEPDYGRDAAHALFREVYGYWRQLPHDRRPKLYLHGLSLGALNSDISADLFDVIGDPFQGALWSGPPFLSKTWGSVTRDRDPGSPVWLPRFRDGSIIRFTAQENALAIPGATWGPIRIVFLQYASDAVTFFDPLSFYRAPAWMAEPRGPDVSPQLTWYPVVTFLQILLDMAMATTTPMGYGHVYAPEHYIDAWVEVLGVTDWPAEEIARLKTSFKQ
ncbi:alpha/beta hydrolase [Mesorhizobium sp. 1B3]|uniref:alpha/beta hydrolase n=1 Tax=Mesorhizobium sp. 1B3 TaxID=3243599 RepID=UPI003D97071C